MSHKTGRDDLVAAVEKTVRLAKLSFDEAGMHKLVAKAGAVLEYVAQLNELGTEGVAPTSHAVEFASSLREDAVHPSGMQDELLAQAPERDGPFVQVPRVIESE